MNDPAAQYLDAWRAFAVLTDGVAGSAWGAPTPCSGWSVRQLVGHVIDGADQVQAMLTGQPPLAPLAEPPELAERVGDDPAAAVRQGVDALSIALAGWPAGVTVRSPAGELPLPQVLLMALIEPVTHGWDLAVATGQRAAFDDDAVNALLVGVEQLGDQLAQTGMYAAARPVAHEAPPLLAARRQRKQSVVRDTGTLD